MEEQQPRKASELPLILSFLSSDNADANGAIDDDANVVDEQVPNSSSSTFSLSSTPFDPCGHACSN